MKVKGMAFLSRNVPYRGWHLASNFTSGCERVTTHKLGGVAMKYSSGAQDFNATERTIREAYTI